MLKKTLTLLAIGASVAALGEGIPIAVTGFNWDGIANGDPVNNNPPAVQASTTGTLDGIFVYFERGFWSLDANIGLPPDGKVVSDFDNLTRYQIPPATSQNLLLLRNLSNPTGTLTLLSPAPYRKLQFLVTGFNGNLPGRYTLHFADSSTSTGFFTAPDNFNQANWAIRGFGRVDRDNDGVFANPFGNPRIYQVSVTLGVFDATKNLAAVEFFNDDISGVNHRNIGIFGISGVPTTPPSMPIGVHGFDFDGVADGPPVENDPFAVQASTTGDLDSQYVYFKMGFWASNPFVGLPPDGAILSALDGNSTFQLQAYDGPNMLLLRQAGSGETTKTLTLNSAASYSRLSFLITGFNGRQPLQYTLNFTTGSPYTDTIFASDNFNTADFALQAFGRVSRTTGAFQSDGSNPRLYQADVWLGPAEASRTLQSITFSNVETTGVNARNIGVFAVSGVESTALPMLSGSVIFGDRVDSFPMMVDIDFKDPNNPATVVHTAFNVPVDGNGNYSTMNLPPTAGSYLASVKLTPWLRKNVGPINTSVTNTSINFVLVNGDCDGDNEVTIGDYAVLSAAFGSSEGDPNWNPAADLNGDLSVDIGDFAILSANFGEVGDD